MRHVRDVLRLGFAGISKHEVARRMGVAASTVHETIERFTASGLDWPLPEAVTDSELEARLYKNAGTKQGGAEPLRLPAATRLGPYHRNERRVQSPEFTSAWIRAVCNVTFVTQVQNETNLIVQQDAPVALKRFEWQTNLVQIGTIEVS